MISRRRARSLLLGMTTGPFFMIVFMIGLSGCSWFQPRSDPTRFYVLTPVAPAKPAPQVPLPSLGLGPVTVPDYLDRPQLVTRLAANELKLSEFDKWGEPLKENLPRVLRTDLQASLGSGGIAAFPWDNGKAPPLSASIDVQQFERVADHEVELRAHWALRDSDGKVLEAQDIAVKKPTRGKDAQAAVAALSEATAALSQELAAAIHHAVANHAFVTKP